jgi:hypothetical protein
MMTNSDPDPDSNPFDLVYCLIDGLDECDSSLLEIFLCNLQDLFALRAGSTNFKSRYTEPPGLHPTGRSSPTVKVILISRAQPQYFQEILEPFPRINLVSDTNSASDARSCVTRDIRQFIDIKVNEMAEASLKRGSRWPESLKAFVRAMFQKKAEGTFLWIGLAAKSLKGCSATETQERLERLPTGLEKLYARQLLLIDIERRDLIAKVLCWVVLALRHWLCRNYTTQLLQKARGVNISPGQNG